MNQSENVSLRPDANDLAKALLRKAWTRMTFVGVASGPAARAGAQAQITVMTIRFECVTPFQSVAAAIVAIRNSFA